MMPLDKAGNPYTPFGEAQQAIARARPYPEGFTEHSASLRERHEREALEPERVYRAREEDRPVEPKGLLVATNKALSRRMTAGRKRRKRGR